MLIFLFPALSPAQTGNPTAVYPRIYSMQQGDVMFRQVQDSIVQAYKAEKDTDSWPDIFFCLYVTVHGDDLFSLAARLSLPYETLATLNGLNKSREFKPGEILLVPSVHGLFIPETARNDIDILLMNRAEDPGAYTIPLAVAVGSNRTNFTFVAGARFGTTERAFFLSAGFRLPLQSGRLSSAYGNRVSPIDGHYRMHKGIDIAAPSGTEVSAARSGLVAESGWDGALGNYIILDHGGGIKTVYGHLSRILVVLNQSVLSGTLIGTVGSTGLSTGPHLHFEIRLGGSARDPAVYLPGMVP